MRWIFIAILLLINWNTFAVVGASTEVPLTPVPADDKTTISRFRKHGKAILPHGECEAILVESGLRIGRPLTRDEIELALPHILNATRESMVESPPPEPLDAFEHCFTAEMKVLTPKGERPIIDLRPGDEVISIGYIPLNGNIQARANKVLRNLRFEDLEYSRLEGLPEPLLATPGVVAWNANDKERKFHMNFGSFKPLEKMHGENRLAHTSSNRWLREKRPSLVRRQTLIPANHRRVMFCLQLADTPNNLIIQGVLVQSLLFKDQ